MLGDACLSSPTSYLGRTRKINGQHRSIFLNCTKENTFPLSPFHPNLQAKQMSRIVFCHAKVALLCEWNPGIILEPVSRIVPGFGVDGKKSRLCTVISAKCIRSQATAEDQESIADRQAAPAQKDHANGLTMIGFSNSAIGSTSAAANSSGVNWVTDAPMAKVAMFRVSRICVGRILTKRKSPKSTCEGTDPELSSEVYAIRLNLWRLVNEKKVTKQISKKDCRNSGPIPLRTDSEGFQGRSASNLGQGESKISKSSEQRDNQHPYPESVGMLLQIGVPHALPLRILHNLSVSEQRHLGAVHAVEVPGQKERTPRVLLEVLLRYKALHPEKQACSRRAPKFHSGRLQV